MPPYSDAMRRWRSVAIVSGFVTVATYVAIQLPIDFPLRVSYLLFMAFGPLFCSAILALHMFLRHERSSVALHVGTLLLVIGGGINTLMAAMQGAVRIYFESIPHDESVAEVTRAAWRMGLHSGNAVQLGADMAWDVYVLSGLVVWGIAFARHPRFGPWFGWAAILIGVGGLTLNSWTFPTPPAAAGLVDAGPLVGIWFTVVTVQVLRQLGSGGTAGENVAARSS